MDSSGIILDSRMRKIVVIGNDPLAVDCLDVLRRSSESDIRLVVSDPQLRISDNLTRYCREHSLPHRLTRKMDSDTTAAIDAARPDLLISAYNMTILDRRLLSIPKLGAVNYHNGPLPKYRGVNALSWAIINGEKRHGVTWHWMDPGIDTGDIIGQKFFPIAESETAFSLAQKCFAAGAQLFGEVLPSLLRGDVISIPQNHSQATYYSLKQFPNGGRIDFNWSFNQLERFLRGLDYRPADNPFIQASLTHSGRIFYAQKASMVRPSTPNAQTGRVQAICENRIDVCLTNSVASLTDLLDADKRPITAACLAGQYGIKVGDRLE